jgi:ATP-dependent DNA helicase RecQ
VKKTSKWEGYVEKVEAENLLKTAIGNPSAQFRNGQWDAIDALVNHQKKLLLVQRTGWGKSSVYFISTRILRDRVAGPTIIISPLLALMRNQVAAAIRLGISPAQINSGNRDEWDEIKQKIVDDEIDVILISPERLSDDYFVNEILTPIANKVGMFVVDEAHCISEWGHDFRPDYQRLVNVIKQMPPNIPILATTATANERVIKDVKEQLGNLQVQRGSLVRKSLSLQTLKLPDQGARLAWMAKSIPEFSGTGLVYVLTRRDAEMVSRWLNENGIIAKAYYGDVLHGDFDNSNSYRLHLEELLLNNQIKVLVATTALGMGYDKADLGFVIHYQTPGSVVHYYQQVGRAGRAIDDAVGIMLSGNEDIHIQEYFRSTAFPKEEHVVCILDALESDDGLTVYALSDHVNLNIRQIRKVLKFLSVENPSPVIRKGPRWFRSPVKYSLDHQRIEYISRQRELEWEEIQNYLNTSECLMGFLQKVLDDPIVGDCGRCENCRGSSVVSNHYDLDLAAKASIFLHRGDMVIEPKKQVAHKSFKKYDFLRLNIPIRLRSEVGRILSRWGDSGWGQLVIEDKHNNLFRDEVVDAMVEMIQDRWTPSPPLEWVTCVPSNYHPNLVPDMARSLASKLGLPFIEAIIKVYDNEPQKNQNNRFFQCQNLDGAFEINGEISDGPVLLVDDVVASGWTMAILAALLRNEGSGPVYPVALASTGVGLTLVDADAGV